MAAAACYERKLGVNEVLMAGHQYHAAKAPPPHHPSYLHLDRNTKFDLILDHFDQMNCDFQQFARESALSIVASAAAAVSSTCATPAVVPTASSKRPPTAHEAPMFLLDLQQPSQQMAAVTSACATPAMRKPASPMMLLGHQQPQPPTTSQQLMQSLNKSHQRGSPASACYERKSCNEVNKRVTTHSPMLLLDIQHQQHQQPQQQKRPSTQSSPMLLLDIQQQQQQQPANSQQLMQSLNKAQTRGSPLMAAPGHLNHAKQAATPGLLPDYNFQGLNIVAAAAAAVSSSNAVSPLPSSSRKSSPLQHVSPVLSRNLVVPGSASLPLKDYSQPLHVDCSVEYELPSQVKPPPGNSEPLLMIHPCYYRRAERERRTLFVNNMPPRASSSSTSTSSSSRRSSRSSKSHTATVPSQPAVSGLTGMMVNPMMPAPAIAPSTQHTAVATAMQPALHINPVANGVLPSPTLASIVQDVQHNGVPAAAAAAAAATYHAALTAAAAVQHPEAKQLHPKLQSTAELDEKLLGLYNPSYFRGVQQPQPQQTAVAQLQQHRHHQQLVHHQQQLSAIPASPAIPAASTATILHQAYPAQPSQQQQPPYGMAAMMAAPPVPSQRHHQVIGSTAGPTVVVNHHHPYRRSSATTSSSSRTNLKHASSTSALVPSSMVPNSGGSSAAAAAASYMAAAAAAAAAATTNVYVRQQQQHQVHHQQQQQQQQQMIQQAFHQQQQQQQQQHHHHHQQQSFYEAPVYHHALLPQS